MIILLSLIVLALLYGAWFLIVLAYLWLRDEINGDNLTRGGRAQRDLNRLDRR